MGNLLHGIPSEAHGNARFGDDFREVHEEELQERVLRLLHRAAHHAGLGEVWRILSFNAHARHVRWRPRHQVDQVLGKVVWALWALLYRANQTQGGR